MKDRKVRTYFVLFSCVALRRRRRCRPFVYILISVRRVDDLISGPLRDQWLSGGNWNKGTRHISLLVVVVVPDTFRVQSI